MKRVFNNWAACEVDESNPVENEDEWELNEDLKCYERKDCCTCRSRI